jgi:4-hydroxybenzoyl-CoA thioesterase
VRLGRTSVSFRIAASGGGEVRVAVHITLVWVTPEGRPAPWPEDMRARLAAHLVKETA